MSISEQGMFFFLHNRICHQIWPLHSIFHLKVFQYSNTCELTSGQIVHLEVFNPLHIRPLGFQLREISDVASVQIVVLRLSPPSISEERCLIQYRFFVCTFYKLLVQIFVWKIGHFMFYKAEKQDYLAIYIIFDRIKDLLRLGRKCAEISK